MIKVQYMALSLIGCLILLFFHFGSEVPVDSGDGLSHFFIAQHVWQDPSELLNHWGKPLFSLLASPWAYFGFTSYILFNILLYLATLRVAFAISEKIGNHSSLLLIFPIGLLTSMDYASNILGGMTEVQFGFLVLFSGLLLLQKRWLWFAVLISFVPFSRSEGQMLIPIAFILLIYYKQWKVLPFIFTGFLVYGLSGAWALDDFWWYITQNPYVGSADIYGQGTWMHYIGLWHLHLGFLGLFFLFFGLIAFIYALVKKPLDFDKGLVLAYFALCYFGILLVHMYLWANGKHGAIGLSRLAIHGWPGLLLLCILLVNHVLAKESIKNALTGLALFAGLWIIFDYPLVHDQPFPRKAQPNERAILDAASFVDSLVQKKQVTRVLYYHPLVAYAVGSNLKDDKGIYVQRSFANFDEVMSGLKSTELIIRDSHFANLDMNFPDDKLNLFQEVAVFTPLNQYVHLGNPVAQVQLLELASPNSAESTKTVILETEVSFKSQDLYPELIEIKTEDWVDNNPKFEIELNWPQRNSSSAGMVYLVVQSAETGESLTFEIGEAHLWSFALNRSLAKTYKFFIHNPNGAEGSLTVRINQFGRL